MTMGEARFKAQARRVTVGTPGATRNSDPSVCMIATRGKSWRKAGPRRVDELQHLAALLALAGPLCCGGLFRVEAGGEGRGSECWWFGRTAGQCAVSRSLPPHLGEGSHKRSKPTSPARSSLFLPLHFTHSEPPPTTHPAYRVKSSRFIMLASTLSLADSG